jgi:hypothetical protein
MKKIDNISMGHHMELFKRLMIKESKIKDKKKIILEVVPVIAKRVFKKIEAEVDLMMLIEIIILHLINKNFLKSTINKDKKTIKEIIIIIKKKIQIIDINLDQGIILILQIKKINKQTNINNQIILKINNYSIKKADLVMLLVWFLLL